MPDASSLSRKALGPSREELSRAAETQDVLDHMEQCVEEVNSSERRSRTKRILLIVGEAGTGKTWFLNHLRQEIEAKHSWNLLPLLDSIPPPGYDAAEFARSVPDNYSTACNFFQDIAQQMSTGVDPPSGGWSERIKMAEWSGALERAFKNASRKNPLILFFDDLERWIGADQVREFLNAGWKMLARQSHLPCIFIAACRKAPSLGSPMLTLLTREVSLGGFPTEELTQLVAPARREALRPSIQILAQNNPLIARLLDAAATKREAPLTLSVETRRELFDAVVGGEIGGKQREVLYRLAHTEPEGFTPEHTALLEADFPQALQSLLQTSLVYFDLVKRRYHVTAVLTRLLNNEEPS